MATTNAASNTLRLQRGLRNIYRWINAILMWGSTGMSGFLIGITSTFLYVALEIAYWVNDINYIAKIMPFVATTTPATRAIDCFAKGIFVAAGWTIWIKHTIYNTQPNHREDLK